MPEPELHSSASPSAPVKPGLRVDDIRHIPARERELRFTRNRSGAILMAGGFLLIITAAFLQLTGYDTITPYLPAPLWVMEAAALLPSILCLYLGRRCLKYAAVIVTPLGVEILPFLRPRRNMQWRLWQQIVSVDRKGSRLTLHLADGTETFISLLPLNSGSRDMLVHAVLKRVNALQDSGYGKT